MKDAQIQHSTELAQVYDVYYDMKTNGSDDIKKTSESLAARLQQSLDSLHHTMLMEYHIHQMADSDIQAVRMHQEAAQ